MKYHALLLLLLLLLIGHHTSLGQNTFSSPYSVYGLGMLNKRTSSLNRAMGGAGIAVRDELNINAVNPASYSAIVSPVSHVFEAGFYVESNRYTKSTLAESQTNGGLNNLSYWFKFKPWWASTLGLSPFSSVSYTITTEKELGAGEEADYIYEGSGNITQLYWGNSFMLHKNLSVGVNLSFLFGSIHKTESVSARSIPTKLTLDNKVYTNKFDADFGIQYSIPFGKRTVVLGAIYNNGLSLTGKSTAYLYTQLSDTLNSWSKKSLRYTLPPTAGAGIALQSSRSILTTDVRFEQWTKAEFPDSEDLRFSDTWTMSAGYAYLGNPNGDRFLDLLSFKTGFYWQNYYLNLKGLSLPNWGLSAGFSIPVFDGKSSIGVTYSFDKLGTTQNNLILQQSQKVMVDVVIRDLWGVRRKFD